jgi:hypothetical protein
MIQRETPASIGDRVDSYRFFALHRAYEDELMSRILVLTGWLLGSSLPIFPALAQDATKDPPQPSGEAPGTWIVTLGPARSMALHT